MKEKSREMPTPLKLALSFRNFIYNHIFFYKILMKEKSREMPTPLNMALSFHNFIYNCNFYKILMKEKVAKCRGELCSGWDFSKN